MSPTRLLALLLAAGLGLLATGAGAHPARRPAGPVAPLVAPRFDPRSVGEGPFPSDRLTVADRLQRTGRRVAVPLPDCRRAPSDCDDLRLLNELDGFDLSPRIVIPLDGPVDLGTVTPRSALLIRLDAGPPEALALDGVFQDPDTHDLGGRPERLLEPEARYGLVLTREVRDRAGRRILAAPGLRRSLAGASAETRAGLHGLAAALGRRGLPLADVAVASTFTTASVSGFLERARDALDRRRPPPALMAAPEGGGRAWFPRTSLARLTWRAHVGVSPTPPAEPPAGDPGPVVRDVPLPLAALPADAVAGVGMGWYWSPSYLGLAVGGLRIAEPPTGQPLPGPLAQTPVAFVVILPAGPRPPAGWPVAMVGHGWGGEMFGTAMLLAATLARHGFATVAITVVGHGGGPGGRLVADLADGRRRAVRAPGRGLDLDGDGRIGATEGLYPLPGSHLAALGLRDGLRQQVVDLMALQRALAEGLDVDGDGVPDTAATRGEPAAYVGHSLGGIYGTLLAAVEPHLRAAVLAVPGGPIVDVARRSPAFRPLLREVLLRRSPALLTPGEDLDEVLPVAGPAGRGPGSLAIEAFLSRALWLGRRGDPVAYAPHLRRAPLPGVEPAPVLVQWARGDQIVPNATTRALLVAGGLADSAAAYRHDRLADRLEVPFDDPHGALLWAAAPGLAGVVGRALQAQAADFLQRAERELSIPVLSLAGVGGAVFEAGGPRP